MIKDVSKGSGKGGNGRRRKIEAEGIHNRVVGRAIFLLNRSLSMCRYR